jgi:tetratricopeptide (TPR) repeat protein
MNMHLVVERKIQSIQKLLAYLLDLDMKLSISLIADTEGGKRRKLTSERGAGRNLKAHYVDFDDDRIGLLEWDRSPGADHMYDVRLYVENSLADDETVRRAGRRISDYPDSPGTVSRRQRGQIMEMDAQAWFFAGEYEKAKSVAERILKMNPDLPRVWNCIGACCSASNDNHQAIYHYMKAIQIDRSIFRVWNNLANRYSSLGDKLRSLLAYSISLIYPDRYRGDDLLRKDVIEKLEERKGSIGYRRHLLQSRDKELNMLWKSTAGSNSSITVDYGTGIELFHAGQYEKAMEEMQKALKAAPHEPRILNDLAHCQLCAGRIDEALRTIEIALSLDGRQVIALVTKAEILMKLSRHREALECYDRGVDLDATNPGALYSKALAEDHLGMREEAERTFKHFIVVSTEAHESQINYARCRLQEYEYWRG